MAERVMTHHVGDGCPGGHARGTRQLDALADALEPSVTGDERRILDAIRDLPHGHVTVYVQDSEIVRWEVTESKKPRRVGA